MNFIVLGIFSIIYLILFGLATENEASFDQDGIDRAIIVTNCPNPIQDGRATNLVVIDPSSPITRPFAPQSPTFNLVTGVNGTGSPTNNINEMVGTRFVCYLQGATVADTEWKLYQKTDFTAFPSGWLLFAGDSIQSFLGKFYGYLVLIGNYALVISNTIFPTPTTTVLGYELQDINSTAQYFITIFNITNLIFITGMMYKLISPFTGGGS